MTYIEFIDCSAAKLGGAVLMGKGASIKALRVQFTGCFAAEQGAALYLQGPAEFTACSFDSNRKTPAVSLLGQKTNVVKAAFKSCVFGANKASLNTGACLAVGTYCTAVVDGAEFTKNTPQRPTSHFAGPSFHVGK